MVSTRETRLFGSRRRSEVMVMVALLGETFPSELARLLGAPLYSVQNIVSALDRDGIVATRISGRARVVTLDTNYFAFKELKALLLTLGKAEPELRSIASTGRPRPRRVSPPLS